MPPSKAPVIRQGPLPREQVRELRAAALDEAKAEHNGSLQFHLEVRAQELVDLCDEVLGWRRNPQWGARRR